MPVDNFQSGVLRTLREHSKILDRIKNPAPYNGVVPGALQAGSYLRLDYDANANSEGMYVNAKWNRDSPSTYNYLNTGAFGGKANRLVSAPGGSWLWDVASGGVNPITWSTQMSLTAAGALTIEGNLTVNSNFGTIDISTAGTQSEFRVRQHDNTNAASHAKLTVEVGGGGGGDPFIGFVIDGVLQRSLGYDNSAAAFVFSDGNNLGTSNWMVHPNTGGVQIVGGFSCNGATIRTPFASGGASVPGAGAFGASSAANFAALVTLVNNIRTALVNDGIMS